MPPPDSLICQATHRNVERLLCTSVEGGALRCERLDPHGNHEHAVGEHSISHAVMGNGFACDVVEHLLRRNALARWLYERFAYSTPPSSATAARHWGRLDNEDREAWAKAADDLTGAFDIALKGLGR